MRPGARACSRQIEKFGVFAPCEDCESEWSHPDETHDTELASRYRHAFARYLRLDELMAHSWYCHVLNK